MEKHEIRTNYTRDSDSSDGSMSSEENQEEDKFIIKRKSINSDSDITALNSQPPLKKGKIVRSMSNHVKSCDASDGSGSTVMEHVCSDSSDEANQDSMASEREYTVQMRSPPRIATDNIR